MSIENQTSCEMVISEVIRGREDLKREHDMIVCCLSLEVAGFTVGGKMLVLFCKYHRMVAFLSSLWLKMDGCTFVHVIFLVIVEEM